MATPALQNYDPTSATPYQAPQMPEPTPAMPSPLPTEAPQVNGAVKQSGAIATIADGILRGFMQGKAYHEARQVLQAKKKSDDLQNSYNQDAVRLYQLTQAGYGSPDATAEQKQQYAAAKSSVDGSWGALMDYYGQHLEPQDKGKKKSKMQKVEGGIMGMFQSKDPMQVSQAWYQVARKTGPPIYGQIAGLQTPEAQAGRTAQRETASAEAKLAQMKNHLIQLEASPIPEDPQKAQQREMQIQEARRALIDTQEALNPNLAAKTYKRYRDRNGTTYQYEVDAEGNEIAGSERPLSAAASYPHPEHGPKEGSFGYALMQKYGPHPTFAQYLEGRREEARARHVAGAGRGGGMAEDKTYQKWWAYYKQHYPAMSDEERDALARRKVEGASQLQAGQTEFDAATQPQQFDSDVLGMAIDNLRKQPQWANAKNAKGGPLNLDDALANIVGLGDNGYQYHTKDQLGAPTDGKYSGAVTADQLKQLERDLQTQVRIVLSRQTGLPPDQKRAAAQRMAPLFGPAAQYGPTPAVSGRGTSPASPPAAAAPTPAPASSPAPAGGLPQEARAHLKHGVVTTFGNGQEWTLDENGNPKRVK